MDEVIGRYFDAWNERDADERRRLLADCLTDDVELVDPVGRAQGHSGLSARIARICPGLVWVLRIVPSCAGRGSPASTLPGSAT